MTTTQKPSPLTGIDLGQAATATRVVFDRLLAREAITFDQWRLVFTVGLQGGTASIDAIVPPFQGANPVDAHPEVLAAAASAGDAGWVTEQDDVVTLTDEGAAKRDAIVAGIAEISATLYGPVPYDDLVVAKRVISQVTANALAAVG